MAQVTAQQTGADASTIASTPSANSNVFGMTRHKPQNTHKYDRKSLDALHKKYQAIYNSERQKTSHLNAKALR